MFEIDFDQIQESLLKSRLDEKDISFRLDRLRKIILNMKQEDMINEQYFQFAHEIRSWQFLSQFGEAYLSQDYKHQSGSDIILNDKYQIECVCATKGEEQNGLSDYCRHDGKLIDYNIKKDIINSRLTQSLDTKVEFYLARAGKSIAENRPFIIFLGLGWLAYEFFAGEYGSALTEILLGRSRPQIIVNGLGEVIQTGYSHREKFSKWNGVSLNCNLFLSDKFRCVSGVFFSYSDLQEPYCNNNVSLFLNPLSQSKIDIDDFPDIVFWKINENNRNEYKVVIPEK